MATSYVKAPDVQAIAEGLIPKFHPHLSDAHIEYVFSNKVPKKGGKEVWGTMRKVTGLNAYLGLMSRDDAVCDDAENTPFFCMVISAPVWDELNSDQRTALVDHELCHAYCEEAEDAKLKLSIMPHDLEEFTQIVQRYGLWREDVKRFVDTAKDK